LKVTRKGRLLSEVHSSTDDTEDDSVELVLVNPETNLPYDEDDPVVLAKDDFLLLKEEAEAKGMTFEEYLNYILKLVIENASSGKTFKKANFELIELEGLSDDR